MEWIRLTWFGNDWLMVGVPLLVASLLLARRGSIRGLLLWLGRLGYGAYNYAYYMLGAALNAFFPLYILPLVLSVVTLILALSRIDVAEAAANFRPKTPVRIVSGYLVFVAGVSPSSGWGCGRRTPSRASRRPSSLRHSS